MNTLNEIDSFLAAGMSKRVKHTVLTEEQYQYNLKLAGSFSQGMRDIREQAKRK